MMENIKIPVGVAIRVDDVGWFEGADDRWKGLPSRSGLPRRHDPRDVLALGEVAKRLGSKIVCDIVLGEWDFNNRLRGEPHVTWDEAGWDAAKVVRQNREFFEKTFEALEENEFLEYGVHGLQHGYYENGKQINERFLYPFQRQDENGKWIVEPLPLDEFDRLLELYFAIYNDWGFKKPVPFFTAGNGAYGVPSDENNRAFARILKKYGVKVFQWGGWPNRVEVQEGVIFTGSVHFIKTWNGFDLDPDLLPDCFATKDGYRPRPNPSGHLTNFVQFQPEKNFETVDKWVNYFRRLTAPFGVMLSAGNLEAASQTVYSDFAKVEKIDGGYRIDLSEVDSQDTEAIAKEFFVSLKGREMPVSCIGGSIFVHECKQDHTIYRIVRDGSSAMTLVMQ